MGYQGNQQLRAANEKIVYTNEMKEEFIRCMTDILYFAEKYCNIITIDEGKTLIKLWDYQKKFLKAMYDPPEYKNEVGDLEKKRSVIALSPRQSGKTTISSIYLAHYAIFNENKTVAVLANKEKTALEIMGRIKMIYENLPLWLQTGVADGGWNKQSIMLGNGTRIIAASTASSAIRGYTINCLTENNFVTVKDKETGEIKYISIGELKNLLNIKINKKLLLNNKYEVLTPDGFKDFDGVIEKGKKKVLKIFTKDSFLELTENHYIYTSLNKKKKAKNIKIGDLIFNENKEYSEVTKIEKIENEQPVFDLLNVKDGHRFFANKLLVSNCLFLDEFAFVPNNVADQFMNSVYPTISSGKTSKIIIVSTPNGMNHFYNIWVDAVKGKSTFFPIKINWWEHPERDENFKRNIIRDRGITHWNQEYSVRFLGSTNTLIDSEVLERIENRDPTTTKWNGIFQIYEEPKPDNLYILGIDSAEGIGKDYSVVQVLKINSEIDLEQVAVFRNNVIDYNKFAQICISISQYYNEAYMMIENNGVGAMVASMIWNDYEYDKIINCDPKGLGIKSTKKTKLEGNLLMKRYMESYWLKICDKQTIYELSLYEEIKPDVYASPDHAHDDCVTSLIWALYFISTEFFDAKNLETKKIEEKFRLANEMNEKPVIFTSDEEDYEDEESDFWLFS